MALVMLTALHMRVPLGSQESGGASQSPYGPLIPQLFPLKLLSQSIICFICYPPTQAAKTLNNNYL